MHHVCRPFCVATLALSPLCVAVFLLAVSIFLIFDIWIFPSAILIHICEQVRRINDEEEVV